MYVEFYNLSENRGYTFPCNGVSICGHTVRIQGPDDDWYFVTVTEDNYFRFRHENWSDFGVSDQPFPVFQLLTFKDARKWLDPQ